MIWVRFTAVEFLIAGGVFRFEQVYITLNPQPGQSSQLI